MEKKLGLLSLIALVVGTMVGGGVYNLPSDIASAGNSGAILVGWCITAIGMISLALVYQNLSTTMPHLDGGIYSYARAGFGEYIGFNAAWGYWISGILGNIALFVLLFSALGYFFPIFGEGNNAYSILGASLLLWAVQILVLNGIRGAAIVNVIATIGKIIPIILFIVVMIFMFHKPTFTNNFWGSEQFEWSRFLSQVRSCMHVTLWVFIGVEGAVVLSGHAKRKSDVGKATVLGLILTLLLYVIISILSLGVIPQGELAIFKTPSMAYVLESVIGSVGATIINLGLIISLLGAIIGWTLLVVEIPYLAGRDGVFPKIFKNENKEGTPVNSLWISNLITQLFLILSLFSHSTYQFLFSLATTSILIPYLLSALFQVKLLYNKDYRTKLKHSSISFLTSILATLYTIWLVYAAGLKYLLIVMLIYAIGIIVFIYVKKEDEKPLIRPYEFIIMLVVIGMAVLSIYLFLIGRISI